MRRLWVAGLLLSLLTACVSDGALQGESAADAKRRADIRLELANAYFADGQPEIALQEIERVLAIDGRRADVLGLRGLAQQQLGQPERAQQSLRQALHISPDDPALQNNFGWVLCESGQGAAALRFFDKALAQRSYASPAKAAMNAGRCSLKLGERVRARAYFEKALASEPGLLPAHASLAQLAFEDGDYETARKQLLPVIVSDLVRDEDFLLALRIERKRGDRAAEQSLAAQWQRRSPDAQAWRDYELSTTDE